MIFNVWSTHNILTSKLLIDDVNTCGTFKWHIHIVNTYGTSPSTIQIFIVHILQMLKFTHMVHMVHMFFMVYVFFSIFAYGSHVNGLVFKMCTYVYTFLILK
jgi:hypothetical protein